MIVQLALDTKKQLLEWQKFKRNQTALSDIKDTIERLKVLSEDLSVFEQQYHRIQLRLDEEHVVRIQKFCDELSSKTSNSYENFALKRRQVLEVNNILEKLSELRQSLQAAWHIYAQQQISPRNELYELVKHLPEVYRQRIEIENILNELNRQKAIVPNSDSELLTFDSNLERIDSRLTKLSSLTPNIQLFLEQVSRGNFTLSDLTDEILDWCQRDDRGRAFKVTFGS